MMQIWYPIEKNNTANKIDYMDQETFNWLWGRSPVPLITIKKDAYKHVMPHAKIGVPIEDNIKMYPLIIFSPGYDGVYEIYTSLIEDLVSHGFIVVTINHPYVSGITVFPDGRTIDLATPPTDPDEAKEFMNMSLRTVVEDAKFVLDHITEMNSTNSNWKGHIDLSKVGMYGHSFGGASTAICCYEDSRFIAGLALDGFFNEHIITDKINKPFLMMIAEDRLNDSNIQYMWEHLKNDTYKVGVIGSTHYAYTDVGILLSHYVPLIPQEILNFGTIPPKKLVNITKTYEITFFEIYLKNHQKEEILQLENRFKEVIFEYK
jgi:dienelactone hydrolase